MVRSIFAFIITCVTVQGHQLIIFWQFGIFSRFSFTVINWHIASQESALCLPATDPTGEHYNGREKVSASGKRCKPWGADKPPGKRGFRKFCRKIDGKDRPGCIIKKRGRRTFEYCDIPACPSHSACTVDQTGPFDVCGVSSCLEFSPSGRHAPFSRHEGDGTIIDHATHSRKRRDSEYDYESDYSDYSVRVLNYFMLSASD